MFSLPTKTFSQDYNSARLVVLEGGSRLRIDLNNLNKYKNGIELVHEIKFGITLIDNNELGHDLQGFDLTVKAKDVINAENPSNTEPLRLNMIRIKAEDANGNLGTGISAGYQDLTTGFVTLFSYTNAVWSDLNWANHQLYISVECGKTNGSLFDINADYYTLDLEFEIVPTGINMYP